MAQLPFDADDRQVWTVSDLVAHVRQDLETSYPMVWVRGEISGFKPYAASGHWYFKLKDDRGTLSVAMFRGANSALRFLPEEGMEVIAGGRLSLYAGRGEFQMIASALEPVGWGALQAAFEQTRRRLDADGLLDADRKRPLPRLPRCVGVVTSESGAAWHDMVRVWRRRGIATRVLLSPSRVQGEGAAADIVAAMQLLQRHGEVDVVIVGRGGGSPEDLWAFNDERLARAIAAFPVPVIAAVGHEIDVTIADLVADCRAATPTAAAEIVAAGRAEVDARLARLGRDLSQNMRLRLLRAQGRLQASSIDRALRRPASLVQAYQQRLDGAWQSLDDAMHGSIHDRRRRVDGVARGLERTRPDRLVARRRTALEAAARQAGDAIRDHLQQRRSRLGLAAARLDALSPLAVLSRGYAICTDGDGNVLRVAARTRPGERVDVRLATGSLACDVREVREDGGGSGR